MRLVTVGIRSSTRRGFLSLVLGDYNWFKTGKISHTFECVQCDATYTQKCFLNGASHSVVPPCLQHCLVSCLEHN